MTGKKIALITSIPSENDFLPFHYELQKIAYEKYGYIIDLYRNGEFLCYWAKGVQKLLYHGKNFYAKQYDVAFIRLAIKASHGGDHYIIREFEEYGVLTINSSQSLLMARDKLHTLQKLAYANLPITPTIIVRTREQIENALNIFNSSSYIIKNVFGSGGRCVLQAYTKAQVYSVFDYIWQQNRNEILMIQPYLGTQPVADVRALYFKKKFWRAMVRTAQKDEFRANVKLGATTEATNLTLEEEEVCQKAVEQIGLDLAGVDFLRTPQGPFILEINGCPGFSGIALAYAKQGISLVDELAQLLQ